MACNITLNPTIKGQATRERSILVRKRGSITWLRHAILTYARPPAVSPGVRITQWTQGSVYAVMMSLRPTTYGLLGRR